ncbi:hypothetical protein BS50DRAFT_489557 [Corynespora cassiicola Philippines]|uniref:BZIP domain-containing protein n=1 Tax=Corynespora cassiicola Philippines TaxID=1448308 RepID=A0A2T2NU61_CORCC|nr:hypothetical protein BS50DRAFT_489557 [Corynespora cassiicola Philippines]
MADSDARGQQGGRPKKRSRAISNLTEEQLQRKRNVDRNAQRAFRQRTKDSIYRLEQQIAGLQQTAAERETRLQHELSALRGTNTSLLQCLDDIAQLASATARSVTDMAAPTARHHHPGGRPFPPCRLPPGLTPPRSRPSSLHSPVFTVLPSHLPPTCPLDEILHDFLETRREMIVQGATPESVLGPPKPTVKALLNTTMAATVHPLCAVMSEVLSTFPHVGQPEKLAFFYLMFKTMRWQICPTDESYSAMPPWLRPTVSQITVPHAAWIDNIPWPGVRDILIQEPQSHPFEVFSQYYSQNVTINWSFDPLDAVSDVDDQVILHSIFEKHICSLKNWTVTSDFQRRFPAMTSAIYFRD